VRALLVVSLLALSFGCKGKPKKRAPPANVATAAGSGSGKKPAPDLMLPHGDGTPPKKTTKKLTKPDFERLSKFEFPGFLAEVRTVGDNVFEVRHKTKDFPRLKATVTIQNCLNCLPMELPKWKEHEQELKELMGGLKNAKSGVESEIGEANLPGPTKVMYHFFVGMATTPGEGGGETTYANAFIAYYNDGINEIRVAGEWADDPVEVEQVKKLAPKEDLQLLALSFMDFYTHQW
jgi:hypothetical protein